MAAFGILLTAHTQWFVHEFARDPRIVCWGADGLLSLASLLLIGRRFRDLLARFCERVGIAGLMFYSLCGLGFAMQRMRDPSWIPTVFLLALTGFCVVYARLTGLRDFRVASFWHLGLNVISAIWQSDLLLRGSPYRIAILSFGLAVGWLLVALFISMSKAGWLHRLKPPWLAVFSAK